MNFLFDGRMKVGDLPDEIRRAAELLERAGASHVYQVRLQLRLLDHYDQLLAHPDQYDFHDILRVPSLKDVLTEDFSDGFANQNIEASQDMPRALN